MRLSDNLKSIRKKKGMTQKTLAEASEVSLAQISRLEQGSQKNPELTTVISISTALGISIDELVFGEASEKQLQNSMKAIELLEEQERMFLNEIISAYIAKRISTKIGAE